MERKLLRFREFADAAGISTAAARTWARQGRIASVKLGRARRIPESELRRIAETGLAPTRAKPDGC